MAREKGVNKINELGGEGCEVRDGGVDRPCIRFRGNVLGVGSVWSSLDLLASLGQMCPFNVRRTRTPRRKAGRGRRNGLFAVWPVIKREQSSGKAWT